MLYKLIHDNRHYFPAHWSDDKIKCFLVNYLAANIADVIECLHEGDEG